MLLLEVAGVAEYAELDELRDELRDELLDELLDELPEAFVLVRSTAAG